MNMIYNEKVTFDYLKNLEINKKIKYFGEQLSKKQQSAEYYIKNRNANPEFVINNIMLGTKAEFFVSQFMQDYFKYPELLPDLNIYDSKRKTWTPDLPYKNLNNKLKNIHVKTCTSQTLKYAGQYTWTFQWGNRFGNGGMDKLFTSNKSEHVVLVVLENYSEDNAIIKYFGKFSNILPLIKDPQKKSLYGIKKCIYFNDIENINKKLV